MKILIDASLCFIGILIYFINRYAHRANKRQPPSISKWIIENWPELITSVLMNTALMILIHLKDTQVALIEKLSVIGLGLTGIPTISFLLGLGLTATFYELFRSKSK